MTKFHLIGLFATVSLFGNPSQAPTVQSGSATVAGIGTAEVDVNITSSTTVLAWDNFSIGSSEQVIFTQTGSSAPYYVFNKVTGSDLSTINGTLYSAEGNIYLFNAAGIVVGSGGVINTGSFVGTTLDLVGSFNPTGNMTFTGTSTNSITNAGHITAANGDVTLIGYRIVSSGPILASGVASIGAGTSVILKPNDSQRVYINAVGANGTGTGISITSSGSLTGEGVNLVAAGNPYTLAINLSGTVTSTACIVTDGAIKLIADPVTSAKGAIELNNATIERSATAGHGPNVEIYGKTIALNGTSSIDVSGETGGGNVIIGLETYYDTQNIYIASGASIISNGTVAGSGGDITLWAEASLLDLGTINTKGAGSGGNGGNIYLTSPGYLGIDGLADTTVSGSGTIGRLIGTTSSIQVGASPNYGSNFAPPSYTIAAVDSIITKASLEHILALSNVTINADATLTTGYLYVVDDITWSSGRNLTLLADQLIQVDYDVTMTGIVPTTNSVVTLVAPQIVIGSALHTQTHTAGFRLTTGSMSASASEEMDIYGGGSTNVFSRFNTDSGTVTVGFGDQLNIIAGDSSGANAEIKGTTVNINALTASAGTITVQAADCSEAFIDGSIVNIGVTTRPANLTILGGLCSANNEAYVGSVTDASAITIRVTDNIVLTGGSTGSGNKASIISNGGTSSPIILAADNVILNGGSGGLNNVARIASLGSGGTVAITTANDVILNGGPSGATRSQAIIQGDSVTFTTGNDFTLNGGTGMFNQAYVLAISNVNGNVGRTLNVNGGSASLAFAEIKVSQLGGLALITGADLNIIGGGTNPTTGSYAGISIATGNVTTSVGRNLTITTGGDSSADSFILANNGQVNLSVANDASLTGICGINTAYIRSRGANGALGMSVGSDLTRRGQTDISPPILSSSVGGTYTNIGCSGNNVNSPTTLIYYQYDFLYELFYRLRYYTYQDWFHFLSDDFWKRSNFTDP